MNKNSSCIYQLTNCVWEITLECCFSCKYCGSKGGKARNNELTLKEAIDVANQLGELGCRRVSLIGGEVFMRSDWAQIAKALVNNNVSVSIITKGFYISDEIIQKLKEVGIESIAISIDGLYEMHDRYTQKGAFRRAINAMEKLIANDIPVSVITTLYSENSKYLEEMYAFLQKYNIFAWQLQSCSPMGNAIDEQIEYKINTKAVVSFVESHLFDSHIRIQLCDDIGYYSPFEGFLRGNIMGNGYFNGCGAGLCSIGIDSIGNVRGCESMYDDCFIEGNLRERSLKDIWEDTNSFLYNRNFSMDLLTGYCHTCEYGKMCAGGCRSYNYFVHKKMYEAPSCIQYDLQIDKVAVDDEKEENYSNSSIGSVDCCNSNSSLFHG